MKYLYLVFSIVFFIGCGGATVDDESVQQNCSLEDQNRFLYNYMKDSYLWNDQIPYITDFSSYSSVKNFLKTLKVPQDRWSTVINKQDFENLFSGDRNSFGIYSKMTSKGLVILYTLPNSPIGKSGLKRGDIIRFLNGESVHKLYQSNTLKSMFEKSQKLNISYYTQDDTTLKSVSIQQERYTTSPVLHSSIIRSNANKIGYVVLQAFDFQTKQTMAEIFSWFKDENINHIIVDLRYNGGGILDQVNYLGYMLKSSVGGKISFYIKFNENHTKLNQIGYFENNPFYNPFNFDTIVFLTSKDTASASESLIHSLKPYANVYLIGDDTHGKPVGMNIKTYCGNNFLPITFRTENSRRVSYGFDGIKVDCKIKDNVLYNFGDTKEVLLRAGIDYINRGTCSSDFARSKSLGDRIFTDIKRRKGFILNP